VNDLEDLYREIVLDHYRSPRNRGELPVPPAQRFVGFNPFCGDEIVLFLELSDGVLTDIKTGGQGCSISLSSTSLMSATVKGQTIDEVGKRVSTFKRMMNIEPDSTDGSEPEPIDRAALGELAALQGVVKFPARIKCATLGWTTLTQGLDQMMS
jgi:nitrogen fixation protein NifU and related proteins